MCGRYTNTATNAGGIRERFELTEEVLAEGLGRANVSPTQQALVWARAHPAWVDEPARL
jgi:putative SOS response-associated peptidase YedK